MIEPDRMPWLYKTEGDPDRIEIERDGKTIVFVRNARIPESYVEEGMAPKLIDLGGSPDPNE